MDYIRIGLVLKPQGIRGEIKVSCLSDRLDRFLELAYVFIEEKGNYTIYKHYFIYNKYCSYYSNVGNYS